MLRRHAFFCLVVQLSGLVSRVSGQELPNPFAEIAALERQSKVSHPGSLEALMREARQRTLYGAERRYARQLLVLEPDHAVARKRLHFERFQDRGSGKIVWLDWYDAWMWQKKGLVRHREYGYCRPEDRSLMDQGKLRQASGKLIDVNQWDAQHTSWNTAHVVLSRHFRIKSTIPLAAVWYTADDLDNLVLAYLDYFEIERLPPTRFSVNLYKTAQDATAAGANPELLKSYGAYYWTADQTLHVKFDSLGGLTAVRHEAAHGLNRHFAAANPHQWFDEGIGVFCQFAVPNSDGSFDFGRYPKKHTFGTTFIDEVQAGKRERMIDIHNVGHVTLTKPYYSRWRAMIDFFMNAEEQKYRMVFLKTMFRRQGDVQELLTLPDIDAAWTQFLLARQPDPDWRYLPLPAERNQRIKELLSIPPATPALAN